MFDISANTDETLFDAFLDDTKARKLFDVDSMDVGETYFCLSEIALELKRRSTGDSFLRDNVEKWDPLRQAACISAYDDEKEDGSWLYELALRGVKSYDERLRQASLILVANTSYFRLESMLLQMFEDPSSYVRGAAVAGLVRLYAGNRRKLSGLQSRVDDDLSDIVRSWFTDSLDDYG